VLAGDVPSVDLFRSTTRDSAMKSSIYVETSIVSYVTARPNRDLVRAAHQQVTREWSATRDAFDLYASQLVLDEAAAGDASAATERLEALRDLPLLELTAEATALGRDLLREAALPSKAAADALHIALAAEHGMDCLLTWNCAHIANATMRPRIEAICRSNGFEPPVICTPLELME
jgi:predicted nucleic acid-binding protein